jgi:hypothetical protein
MSSLSRRRDHPSVKARIADRFTFVGLGSDVHFMLTFVKKEDRQRRWEQTLIIYLLRSSKGARKEASHVVPYAGTIPVRRRGLLMGSPSWDLEATRISCLHSRAWRWEPCVEIRSLRRLGVIWCRYQDYEVPTPPP